MKRFLAASACGLILSACATAPEILPYELASIPAATETDPMVGEGDRADDPAIWVNPDDAAGSLILGTNKKEGLHVYDLSGREVQFLPVGMINNVDVRGTLAVASNDETNAITWFEITGKSDAPVLHLADTPIEKTEPYGICMGQDESVLTAVTFKDGTIEIYEGVPDESGTSPVLARTEKLPSQLEGCVFDEARGLLFIGEETFGIWSLAYRDETAEPQIVDTIANGNGLVEDVEGVSLWASEAGGYLVASAQAADRFVVYDLLAPHTPRGVFTVSESLDGSVDVVTHTDGLDISSAALPGYPDGLVVVQDDGNPASGVDQNFKFVDWTAIKTALGLE